MKGDREKCHQAGCSGFLSKPINVDELVRTVSSAVGGSRHGRPASDSSDQTPRPAADLPLVREVRSLLPTDDPELRAIVVEFAQTLEVRLGEMEEACRRQEFPELSRLAHWLKGAGGTVGFDHFTAPAKELEQSAKDGRAEGAAEALRQIRELEEHLVV
jgi:HPt (histidine-containing phosphotransfer) domain-containing protein